MCVGGGGQEKGTATFYSSREFGFFIKSTTSFIIYKPLALLCGMDKAPGLSVSEKVSSSLVTDGKSDPYSLLFSLGNAFASFLLSPFSSMKGNVPPAWFLSAPWVSCSDLFKTLILSKIRMETTSMDLQCLGSVPGIKLTCYKCFWIMAEPSG